MPAYRRCDRCGTMEEFIIEGNVCRCLRCNYVYPSTPADPALYAQQAGYVWPFQCPTCHVLGRITAEQRDHTESILCTCGYYEPRSVRLSQEYQQENVVRRGVKGWRSERTGRRTPYGR